MAATAIEIEVPAIEVPSISKPAGGQGGRAEARVVRLSSPDRPMWEGITKADLARYTVAVGERALAALGDRPVTLQRFPNGTIGVDPSTPQPRAGGGRWRQSDSFYSKNPPKGVPEWARAVPVRYPSGRVHDQLVIDEVATAVWAVQMGTVTFHPWPVRTACTDNPDQLRIDLDPQQGRGYADAVTAALALREVLGEAGLTGFPKTSGNRGVHVDVPIEPTHEFLDVRHAVIAIARELERRLPELVTTAWWKEERGRRVFVDFNQACRDRTLAGAYSPRPLPHAPVSMPLAWAELPGSDPGDFTVRTVPGIVASTPDPRAEMPTATVSLDTALQWWERDVEAGLGELPFPPDYPKMPGEPPRVQPSRKNAANWTDDDEPRAPRPDGDAQ